MSQQLFTRSSMSDSRRLKSDILDFLRRHGASRVSSLTEELGVSRGQVQYQLSLLEAEALVSLTGRVNNGNVSLLSTALPNGTSKGRLVRTPLVEQLRYIHSRQRYSKRSEMMH